MITSDNEPRSMFNHWNSRLVVRSCLHSGPSSSLETRDWSSFEFNHLYEQIKNQPYMYHNGGLWPVLTGLYAVGLVSNAQKQRAKQLLTAINAANAQASANEQWHFSEYHHGQSHLPMGTKHMAWSAAAGVLAYQAVWHGITPWPF